MKIDPLYIGIMAGIFTVISMIPQLVKILKEKKAEQVSVPMIVILLAGLAMWIWYGIVRKDIPLVMTNGFSFLLNSALILFSLKYKKAP